MTPELTADQESDLFDLLNAPTDGPQRTPIDIMNQIRGWVAEQRSADVEAWFTSNYPTVPLLGRDLVDGAIDAHAPSLPLPHDRPASAGHKMAAHLNSIGARDLSFGQAANLGVELVHHPDSNSNQVFHTADGDVVYLRSDDEEWDVVERGRNGLAVKSGDMHRIHTPYISEHANVAATATIADTATVEPGARVGPHSTVGEHAHIGLNATVSSYARVEDGAFVGAFSSIRDGSRIGPGAVIGTGSTVGSTTNVGAGARLEQHTEVGAFDNVAANSRVGGSSTRDQSRSSRMHPAQVTQLIDRLASLDRD